MTKTTNCLLECDTVQPGSYLPTSSSWQEKRQQLSRPITTESSMWHTWKFFVQLRTQRPSMCHLTRCDYMQPLVRPGVWSTHRVSLSPAVNFETAVQVMDLSLNSMNGLQNLKYKWAAHFVTLIRFRHLKLSRRLASRKLSRASSSARWMSVNQRSENHLRSLMTGTATALGTITGR